MNNAALNIETAKPAYSKLAGSKGAFAAIGEVAETRDGKVCWKLHPAYAAWFWPLMLKATALSLFVPEELLEPVDASAYVPPPRRPTEDEIDVILKAPEPVQDAIQVHTLVLKGKQPSVHKAFPTRMVSLAALRYCCTRLSKHVLEQRSIAAT
jgi:hypothetical protein